MSTTRRQDLGLGSTPAGGSGGSFAPHNRWAAPPPAVATIDQNSPARIVEILASDNPKLPERAGVLWEPEMGAYADAMNTGLFDDLYSLEYDDNAHTFVLSHLNADGDYPSPHAPLTTKELHNLLDGDPKLRESVEEMAEVPNDPRSPAEQLSAAIPDSEQRERASNGYITAALWSTPIETEDGSDGAGYLMDDHDVSDLHPEALASAQEDLASFITSNRHLVDQYLSTGRTHSDLGHDFWLTRNGHGTGFWDRGLGDLGKQLSDQSSTYGSVNFFLNGDGKVWAE